MSCKHISGFFITGNLKLPWRVLFLGKLKFSTCKKLQFDSYRSEHSIEKKFLNVNNCKIYSSRCYSGCQNFEEDESISKLELSFDAEEENVEYEELIKRTFRTPVKGHQVFVIQPYIKWGPLKNNLSKPVYKLNESIALIETLDDWKVVDQEIKPVTSFNKVKFFKSGNLELLKERVRKNKLISAVFLSVNLLSRPQQEFLEEVFCVPVYDRYNIVIQIFQKHAVTKEAKLQVAMAEIPFLWYRIKSNDDKGGGGAGSIGGSGETLLEVRKRLLTEREQKLKRALKKLETHRTLLRNKRKKKEFPIIAVVGYTNAGKTSLIKALTEADKLQPKNKLFATLDVTMHHGLLPSNIKVLFADTIGFISDIPTELIQPFNVTLEDAVQSDVLINVLDVSNPDVIAQSKHVMDTLNRFNLNENLINNIINVGNKCDLMSDNNLSQLEIDSNIKDVIYVSSVKLTNIYNLRTKIENVLLTTTGRIPIKIRIKNGGPEFRWLYKESSVVNIISDDSDSQFVYMHVIITESNLSKFKHEFIISRKYKN